MENLLETYILNKLAHREKEESSDEDLEFMEDEDTPHPIVVTPCKRPRMINYVAVVDLYSDNEFKSHFRLRRSTFEYILKLIRDDLKTPDGCAIEPKIQLMLALWKMATPESFRSVADRFNVGKATAFRALNRVIKALNKRITMFIKWPNIEACAQIAQSFESKSRFPNIMGAIDGTHFEIETPKINGADYINRKKYASIQMQAVCDHRCLLTHIYVGHPGSVHDMRVFRQSPIPTYFGNIEKFPNDMHLVGDSAYTIHKNLMVPYKDNGRLTSNHKQFNVCLSSARVTIERTFGILKGRWRSLLNCIPLHKVESMPKFISACCILHNICIMESDFMEFPEPPPDTQVSQASQVDEDHGDEINYREAGLQKRNNIMSMLSQ